MNSSSSVDVRTATVGELCRRATSLAARAIVPLGLAYSVIALIGAVMTLVETSHGNQRGLSVEFGQVANPSGAMRAEDVLAQQRALQYPAWASVLTFLVVDPLVSAAMIAVASSTYLGIGQTLPAAFSLAARRYAAMLGLSVLWLAAAFAAGAVAVVAALLVTVLLVLALAAVHVHARHAGVMIASALPLAAMFVAFVACVMAFEMSRVACVVEGSGPWRSFLGGVGRAFTRAGYGRTLLAGAIVATVLSSTIALGFVESKVGLGFFHSVLAEIGLGVVSGAASAIWVAAFSVVFYDDLRAREATRGRLAESPR